MIGLSPEKAAQHVSENISVIRVDIARAKTSIMTHTGSHIATMVDDWQREQGIAEAREVNIGVEDCRDALTNIAKAYSVRLAYYQALWELINAGFLVSTAGTAEWMPGLTFQAPGHSGGLSLGHIACPYPGRIYRLPAAIQPADTDIFLGGIDRTSLHSGILEAIDQSLACFRRGLYMPATVMLAAAV